MRAFWNKPDELFSTDALEFIKVFELGNSPFFISGRMIRARDLFIWMIGTA